MRKLGNEKNFTRVGIFHLLTWAIARDIDIPAAGIEGAEDITRLAGHRLRGGELRLAGDAARRARRGFRSFRYGGRRRTRRRAGPRLIAALRIGGRRGNGDCSARGRDRVGRGCRRRGGRRRILLRVNLPPDIICRRIEHPKGSVRDLSCRGATACDKCGQQKDPRSRFHFRYSYLASVPPPEKSTSAFTRDSPSHPR